jgi:hypothetical protein
MCLHFISSLRVRLCCFHASKCLPNHEFYSAAVQFVRLRAKFRMYPSCASSRLVVTIHIASKTPINPSIHELFYRMWFAGMLWYLTAQTVSIYGFSTRILWLFFPNLMGFACCLFAAGCLIVVL